MSAEQELSVLPSLTRSSIARSLADVAGVALGLVASVLTARWLGPAGKGLLASLTVLMTLVSYAGTLGLGEAAIVWVAQKKITLQRALSATVFASFICALVGMAALWGAGMMWFSDDGPQARSALLIAVVAVPFYIWIRNLTLLLNARERVGAGSAVLAVQAFATTLALVVLVGWFPLGVQGGSLANLVGAVAAWAVAVVLTRPGVSFRPRWDWTYLKPAVRYGMSVEASHLMIIGFLRGDLLLVYALLGSVPAGHYSVALTAGALITILPLAISTATFPRLAGLADDAADLLIAQVCRFGMIAAAGTALTFIIAAPLAVPILFGETFQPAVTPSVILALAGVVVSAQWILCRAQAARGRPGLQLWYFMASLAVMVAADLVLIPVLGINGAALGALLAPVVGLALTVRAYRRADWWSLSPAVLIPRSADICAILGRFRTLVRRR